MKASPDTSAPMVLVVDDDELLRRLNTEVLARSGYRVDCVEDGAAAWDVLATTRYDLMITDHTMPRLTGLELLKTVRAARMDLPVILATGTLPGEEIARSPWLQPAITLLKPYSAAKLLAVVQETLRTTCGGRPSRSDALCSPRRPCQASSGTRSRRRRMTTFSDEQ